MLEGTELPPEVQLCIFVSCDSLVRPSTRGVSNAQALRTGPALEIRLRYLESKNLSELGNENRREDFGQSAVRNIRLNEQTKSEIMLFCSNAAASVPR